MEHRSEKTTQARLSRRLGCSQQQISKWKLGKTGLSVKTALKWSEELDIDFKKLLTAPARDRAKLLGLE